MYKKILLITFIYAQSAYLPAQTCISTATETAPSSGFTDNGDGTATDNATGLMWKQCSEGFTYSSGSCTGSIGNYNWRGALGQAVSTNHNGGFAGYTDWRLPNINELRSILEQTCEEPSINTTIFFDSAGVSEPYWTSTAPPYLGKVSFSIDFGYADEHVKFQSYDYAARLVRDGS